MRSDYNRFVAEKNGLYTCAIVYSKRYSTKGRTNRLDYDMGGHVGSGETYVEVVLCEIKEELKLEASNLRFIRKFESTGLPYLECCITIKAMKHHGFVAAHWFMPGRFWKNSAQLHLPKRAC